MRLCWEPNHDSPSLKLKHTLLCCVKRYQTAFAVVLSIAIANYGVSLFDFALHIDDELALYDSPPGLHLVARGRWGLYILSHLLVPEAVSPIVPMLFSLACLSLAAVLFSIAWDLRSSVEVVAVSALIVGFPAMTAILVFKSVAIGIGLGFLLCALAVWIVDNLEPNRMGFWVAMVLVALATSMYQAMAVVGLGAFLIKAAMPFLREDAPVPDRKTLATISIYMLVVIAGYALHGLLTRGLTFALGLREDPYVASILGIPAIWETANIRFRLGGALLARILSGSAEGFGVAVPLWPVLWVFTSALLLSHVVIRRQRAVVLGFILVGAVLAINVVASLVVGASLRMAMGFAVFAGGVGAVALRLSQQRLLLRVLSLCLVGLTAFQFAQTNSRLLGSANLAYQNDRMLAQQIASKIAQLERRAGIKARYLEVSGYWQPVSTKAIVRVETIGASFFEWDGGEVSRIRNFLTLVGMPLLEIAPPTKRIAAIHASLKMPHWPEEGSVALVDDVAVIKFGPLSPNQLQAIKRICSLLPDEVRTENRTQVVCSLVL